MLVIIHLLSERNPRTKLHATHPDFRRTAIISTEPRSNRDNKQKEDAVNHRTAFVSELFFDLYKAPLSSPKSCTKPFHRDSTSAAQAKVQKIPTNQSIPVTFQPPRQRAESCTARSWPPQEQTQ